MEFKKPASDESVEDEEVKKDEAASEEEDDLDLEEKEESAPKVEDADSEEEKEEGSDSEEDEESEEEEKSEAKPVARGRGRRASAPVLDEDDATKGLEKKAVVAPVEKIGDLIEDRRFALREKAINTREHLAAQPLIRMMIPRSENEAKDASQFFSINGFAFYLLKGKYVNVPEDVATLISDSYGQDARIVADHPLNLANNTAAQKEFSR